MNPLARIAPLALVLGLFAAPPWANAHSVWIEPGPDAALVVRFGEPGEEPERSPGHLDEFTLPVAFTLDTNGVSHVLATVKKEDHFAVTPAPATEVLGLETAYEVMGAPGKPGRMPLFYARWQPSGAAAGTPVLTLDLVPGDKAGEVRAYFQGKPLPGIAATLRAPDGVERELKADADGWLRFTEFAPGQYHLSIARHRETRSGFHAGRPYDTVSYNAALTWVHP